MEALLLLLLIVLPVFFGRTAAAQVAPATVDTTDTSKLAHPATAASSHSELIFGAGWPIKQPAVFEGGMECLFYFLYQNNQLRQPAQDYPSGKVFVVFVVDTAGLVQDARILKGLRPPLDTEELRLVNLLSGRFTPARQHNKRPVAVTYTIPIAFPAVAPTDKNLRKRCASSFITGTP